MEVMAEDSDLEDGKASNIDGNGRLANAATSLNIKMSKGVNKAE